MESHVNQAPPNPSEGALEGAPFTTRTSAAANGSVLDSGTAGRTEIIMVPRVLRVQLDALTDEQWGELRSLACEAAQFCNACLADSYMRARGYTAPDQMSVFRRAAGHLSGDVRVALAREAFTAWKRHGAKIVAGVQRLAEFQADRALVCRAEHMSKGRRQRHAWVTRVGDQYRLVVRLVGKAYGTRHEYALWWKPQSDEYISPVLERLVAGSTRLLKISMLFERPGRKVFVLLTYEAALAVPPPGERHATFGPLESDGTLWLRIEGANGRQIDTNYTDRVARLLHMKEHFSGIHARLRLRLRRSGAGHRQASRRALVKAGHFSAWAHGVLHAWSHEIIDQCRRAGVGHLAVAPIAVGELPMAELEMKVKYKAAEHGILMSRLDVAERSTARAIARPIDKRRRSLYAKRKALRILSAPD